MRRRRIRRLKTTTELNITAFMNLLVILVPFLLITAVFSQITILKLNLPRPEPGSSSSIRSAFDLKIIIRKNVITVLNGRSIIKEIPLHKGRYNFKLLSQILTQVKAKHANKQAITILSEPNISYVILVHAINASRSFSTIQKGSVIEAELFPEISIGDAPGK